MSAAAKWTDLAPRVLSGVAMAGGGAAVLWTGGWIFAATVVCLCGLMAWESARMFGADHGSATRLGLLAATVFAVTSFLPGILVVPILVAAAIAGSSQVMRDRRLFGAFAGWFLVAAYSMLMLRIEAGLVWILWLVCVVIASDVAGYFAGRTLGGPKFWPRISPKKTWSGTIAGWIGAAVVGLIFAGPTSAGFALVPVSMLVALAGQMGDILESGIKRRTGVKDSSNLIPGHGGVLDRLDAMLGAAMLVMVLWFLRLLPGLT